MNLTDEQSAAVKRWLAEEAGISEVQTRLKEEFGVALTYLDTRLLLDDLKLEVADAPEEAAPPPEVAPEHSPSPATPEPPAQPGTGGGAVSVRIDQITKPGAVISGKVTFSDGESAEWMLDQMGRLGLSATKPGYRPSEQDVMAFQTELQKAVQPPGGL